MPDTDWRNNLEDLDALMPWSEAVQANVKANYGEGIICHPLK